MDQLISQFLQHKVYIENRSLQTIRVYRQSLSTLDTPILTKPQLDAWIIGLRQRGLTPGGINLRIRSINSYLTWLHAEGHAPQRLRVKLLKAPCRTPTILTDQDIQMLLRWKATGRNDKRAYALLLFLLDTGVRIDEALTLKHDKVDLDNLMVVVRGKGDKERPVPISRECRKHLVRFRSSRQASRSGCIPICCGTRLPARSLRGEGTSIDCRASWGTPQLARHNFTYGEGELSISATGMTS